MADSRWRFSQSTGDGDVARRPDPPKLVLWSREGASGGNHEFEMGHCGDVNVNGHSRGGRPDTRWGWNRPRPYYPGLEPDRKKTYWGRGPLVSGSLLHPRTTWASIVSRS